MKKTAKLDSIDVVFDAKPLTNEEKLLISDSIRRDKLKRKKGRVKLVSKDVRV